MAYDSEYFAGYYKKNKKAISDRRKQRYREDPEYRKKCIASSRETREGSQLPKPQGFDLTFDQTAAQLGVPVWSLREWRKRGYFPQPLLHGGRMWFRQAQVELLRALKALFAKGTRLSKDKQNELHSTVEMVLANW